MTDRFNPWPIFSAAIQGAHRRNTSEAGPDRMAIAIMIGGPASSAVLIWATKTTVLKPDQVTSAFALLSGSLLAAFALLATWRGSVARSHLELSDTKIARDRIDEAVGECLAATIASVFGGVSMTVLGRVTKVV